mmetsp:Transcript_17316/g.12379  ORF Transcript_17316/g.12379 Transcript_17316/m.12379 type:complete len:162 (-) Transcript_17316:15-500(-)
MFCYFFVFVKMANPKGFNKKALLVLLQLLFLMLSLFGNIISVNTECQALLLLLTGLLYYESQHFFSLFSLVNGLETIFKEQGRPSLCLSIVLFQLCYHWLVKQFLQATMEVVERTKEKQMRSKEDDEGVKKEKPINELFKIKGADQPLSHNFTLQVKQYFL